MWSKIKAGLAWFAAGVAAVLGAIFLSRREQRKVALEVIDGGKATPRPLPPTQEGVDIELDHLGRIKR